MEYLKFYWFALFSVVKDAQCPKEMLDVFVF